MSMLSEQVKHLRKLSNTAKANVYSFKALTVIQPWAALLVFGRKRCETRSWKTNYRGKILIHAGKKDLCQHLFMANPADVMKHFENAGIPKSNGILPTGAIVGKANLVNCVQIDALTAELIRKQHPDEYVFGNFTPGRYAWVLENPQIFKNPIPVSGKLGLWNWEPTFKIHASVGKTEKFLNEMAKYEELFREG